MFFPSFFDCPESFTLASLVSPPSCFYVSLNVSSSVFVLMSVLLLLPFCLREMDFSFRSIALIFFWFSTCLPWASGIWALFVNRPHFSDACVCRVWLLSGDMVQSSNPHYPDDKEGLTLSLWGPFVRSSLLSPDPTVEGWAPRWSHGDEVTAPRSDRTQTRC